MGHLLMVESWVGAMSTLLPRAVREAGHRFSFLTRDLQHYLRSGPGPHPLLAADNVLTAETNDVEPLLEHVAALHRALEFDGVFSSCDYYLPTVARIAQRLGLPGAAPEAVERACRKDLTREVLGRAGVPGPEFAVTGGWDEVVLAARRIGFPVVVKPVDLCAGMFVRVVTNETELGEAVRALQGFPVNARQQVRSSAVLVEELLDGPEVSVETVTANGETTVVGVTDKSIVGAPWFVESGHMFPADLTAAETALVTETAVAAIEALGLDRVVGHTEIKLTSRGPKVVEVNPRPAGNRITELVRRTTGVDLPMLHARLALGETPEVVAATTGARSAAVAFLLPPHRGVVAEIDGVDALAAPDVVEWAVKPAGHAAGEPTSNNTYLGHAMVVDRFGLGARARVEELVAGLKVRYAG
ncbi:argininosuccinate lyase [Actinokineospora baliensis]|uniref:ATP-grasp domain-containing protein n=1 Tax=Actinokineospora baliensis TaxID=547056 RepID=UPI0019591C46|nr:ATP-grasp domain-containing protein [Actinokineospora baliensis]MBM7775323.1 argininosuccinate lyase [Actinokineospora baliensis]